MDILRQFRDCWRQEPTSTARTRLWIAMFPGSRAVVYRDRLIIGEPSEPTFESSFSYSM
ncbi:hypothetical protein GBAR_LOCUS1354 [Geodia barretti]|uniref:Uncharacterized protein n=1 Tax=Geodia barretti TaxID=519541 RepID=A0AA35W0L4_GEOBA|nr:hypothetical protein GBAR_LOCUS1354 [Geodia barretti]